MEESGLNRLRAIHKYVWIRAWRIRPLSEARLTKAYLSAFVVGRVGSAIAYLQSCQRSV